MPATKAAKKPGPKPKPAAKSPKGVREKLSDQLIRIIKESGLSLYDISRGTGIAQPQLHSVINGTKFLGKDNLDALGDLFQLRLVMPDHLKPDAPA